MDRIFYSQLHILFCQNSATLVPDEISQTTTYIINKKPCQDFPQQSNEEDPFQIPQYSTYTEASRER